MSLPAEELDFSKLGENVDNAITLMRALSNRYRLMILCTLLTSEKSVSELNAIIDIPQSTLSQHLAWLRSEHYVKTRREAQTIYYQLDSDEVIEVITVLHRLFCPDEA
ncbi:MAG: metalloregulator ArsR/SmtB family transcription factor [Alteromonadaceae bacterium]|nr:metalloregulator ArsR/SmtB family transcription factor [Alteromonadaceae bacterium]